jgi:hypothetical protein
VEPAARPNCHAQTWPYYSNDCLVRSDGGPVIRVVRVIQS